MLFPSIIAGAVKIPNPQLFPGFYLKFCFSPAKPANRRKVHEYQKSYLSELQAASYGRLYDSTSDLYHRQKSICSKTLSFACWPPWHAFLHTHTTGIHLFLLPDLSRKISPPISNARKCCTGILHRSRQNLEKNVQKAHARNKLMQAASLTAMDTDILRLGLCCHHLYRSSVEQPCWPKGGRPVVRNSCGGRLEHGLSQSPK